MVKIPITVLVSWNRSRKKNYRLISHRIFRNLLNHSKRILLLLYKEQSAVVSLNAEKDHWTSNCERQILLFLLQKPACQCWKNLFSCFSILIFSDLRQRDAEDFISKEKPQFASLALVGWSVHSHRYMGAITSNCMCKRFSFRCASTSRNYLGRSVSQQ